MSESCGARRHAGAWVPSLRKTRTRGLAMLTAAALLFPSDVTFAADAFDKEAAYAELQAIGAQIDLLKGSGDADSLLVRYRELSAQFGGDDPAGVLGGGKGRAAATLAPRAPRAPFGAGSCSTTTQVFTQNTPVAIPTTVAVVTSTLNVAGAGAFLVDLDLTTNLTHTFVSDLDITLMSPAGTVVTLTTDNGGVNDDVFNGTVWDDNANPAGQVPYTNNNGVATDHLYVNLTTATPLVAEESMNVFLGENPNGVWTITISDDANLDGGSLNSWSLALHTLPSVPPNSVTPLFTQATPVAIPPTAPPNVVTSTLTVPAVTGEILQMILETDLTHTFSSDLDVTLTSPAGTVVTLTTDNAGVNDNVFAGTQWADFANPGGQVPYTNNNGLVTDHLYVNLTTATPLVPEEAFGAFVGESPSGTWTITISDDANLDGGSLDSWSLVFLNASCAPTVAAAALSVDAGGNNVLQPGETAAVAPSWTNSGAAPAALTGGLSAFTGPAGPTYTIVDGMGAYNIMPGATAPCTDCYSVSIAAASRPVQHWDTTVLETLNPGGATKSWTMHVGDSFADVPPGNPFFRFIEILFHRAVTGGCGGQNYCPASSTTREQMAVFVLLSKEPPGYAPPACVAGAEIFPDVPASSPFCRWVEELFNRAVVSGCGGGNYCPSNPVTREQMTVFVLRTLDPALSPPACVPPNIYNDVPETSAFCRWIEELTNRAVVSGCGGGNFCPANPVTREQMGVFLAVTFSLTLYGL